MSQQWFIVRSDGEDGPHTSSQLKSLADSGFLTPQMRVRKDTQPKSIPAGNLKGLFADELTADTSPMVPPGLSCPLPKPIATLSNDAATPIGDSSLPDTEECVSRAELPASQTETSNPLSGRIISDRFRITEIRKTLTQKLLSGGPDLPECPSVKAICEELYRLRTDLANFDNRLDRLEAARIQLEQLERDSAQGQKDFARTYGRLCEFSKTLGTLVFGEFLAGHVTNHPAFGVRSQLGQRISALAKDRDELASQPYAGLIQNVKVKSRQLAISAQLMLAKSRINEAERRIGQYLIDSQLEDSFRCEGTERLIGEIRQLRKGIQQVAVKRDEALENLIQQRLTTAEELDLKKFHSGTEFNDQIREVRNQRTQAQRLFDHYISDTPDRLKADDQLPAGTLADDVSELRQLELIAGPTQDRTRLFNALKKFTSNSKVPKSLWITSVTLIACLLLYVGLSFVGPLFRGQTPVSTEVVKGDTKELQNTEAEMDGSQAGPKETPRKSPTLTGTLDGLVDIAVTNVDDRVAVNSKKVSEEGETKIAQQVREENSKAEMAASESPANQNEPTASREEHSKLEKAERLMKLMVGAGFDEDEDWYQIVDRYVQFGSHETAAKHDLGDEFDRIEIKKATELFRQELKTKRLLIRLKFFVTQQNDVESKGVVAELRLPMRVTGEDGPFADSLSYSGSLQVMHPSEVNFNDHAFLTKDNQLRPCNAQEALIVKNNNGVIYLQESRGTTLLLTFNDKLDVLKNIYRNSKDYTVEIEFTDLSWGPGLSWGYYRWDAYLDADGDCQKLWLDSIKNWGTPQPVYFATSFVDVNEEAIPEMVSAKLTSLRVIDKAGWTVGGYKLPSPLSSTDAPKKPLATEVAGDMITNSIGMKLKLIPAGEFLMGSPGDEADRGDHEKQHRVNITKPYYLGVTEVTQGQWYAVMETKPWGGNYFVKEDESFPATFVSWDDAVEYCQKLSAAEGKSYRLPTEAEWEYACRGGTSTAYSFGADVNQLKEYAWLNTNAKNVFEDYAHQVGRKQANLFGFYDMHGNVWEWCSDWFDKDYEASSPGFDPVGAKSGSSRVTRGGGWSLSAKYCRSANRYGNVPSRRCNDLGFRLALSPSGSSPRISTPTTSTPPMSAPKPPLSIGDTADVITNSIGIKLKLIPAGEFLMGSSDDEAGHSDYEKPHPVKITKPYFLGVTEVTQEQWHAVMKTKPWEGKGFVKEGATYPATYVSWHDAVEYCAKLSESEGKSYRLPTEAEWEFGCRGGKSTAYSFGPDVNELSEYAWVMANAFDVGERYAHEAGTRKPNNFGLHDMHGNVLEWCSDWYNKEYYSSSAVSDPMGATAGSFRVFRGGGWDDSAEDCRSAYRGASDPSLRDDILGFRLALSQSSQ